MRSCDSAGKHRTIMKDILIVHFIAKTYTDSRSRLAGVVATTHYWAELDIACNDMMRPRIIYERYRFARKQAILCCTIRRI